MVELRHLHPLAWLALSASLAVTVARAGSVVVTLTVLSGAIVVSAARQGPRASAFIASLKLGALLAVIVMVIGLFTGPSASSSTTVVFTVPYFELGAGGGFGGVYTTFRLAATATHAADVLVYTCLVGLAWQACPAGQWCDLAETFLGRAGLVLAPMLCLGEAVARARQTGHPRWGLAATIVDHDMSLASSWWRYSPHRGSSARSSLIASIATTLVVLLVLAAGMFGGVSTGLGGGSTISGPALLGGIACCWAVLRLTVGGARFVPSLTAADVVAVVAATVPAIAVLAAGFTGDAPALHTPQGTWPALPPVTLVALGATTVAMSVLSAVVARRRSGARDAATDPAGEGVHA